MMVLVMQEVAGMVAPLPGKAGMITFTAGWMAELVDDRLQDGSAQAEAHERNDTGKSHGKSGFGLAPWDSGEFTSLRPQE
ncbi:MAG TPA: hypothetical protein VK110_11365 [Salinisphaeraceae bacterium]|nr:hypothetical protein [Salinisphaeraceae bacterium]